jgi:23S rRNA (cytosine1962-C5)-methyltransferase
LASKINAQISGFSNLPVRWILDDAIAFLKREIKRGNSYNGIIMDPPAFGRGSKGEVWKIEKDFENLLKLAKEVLAQKPLFFLINGYASGYSSIAYENSLRGILTGHGGTFENGELTIEESDSKRLLPAGIFCRWNA